MKIAYFVRQYTAPGGTERILAEKANYLVRQGHEVHIIVCIHEDQEPFFNFDKRIQIYKLGIDHKELKYRSEYLEKAQKIVDNIKPDISISNGIDLSKYIYLLKDNSIKILEEHFCKFKRKTKLAKCSENVLGRYLGYLYATKKRRLVTKYDKYVVLTQEDREQWFELNDKQIAVVENMISIPVLNTQPDYSQKKILGVGRLTGQKGWDYLLESWGILSKKYPDWTIVICGEGSQRAKLEKRAKELGVSNSFVLKGVTSDIQNEMLDSSIYVLPSRYEGLPLVLLEAMSVGLPPVAFTCKCGPRDVIKDGQDGFLVPRFNVELFAEKLEALIKDEDLRKKVGQEAQKSVQRFSPDKIMAKWGELFRDLVK